MVTPKLILICYSLIISFTKVSRIFLSEFLSEFLDNLFRKLLAFFPEYSYTIMAVLI